MMLQLGDTLQLLHLPKGEAKEKKVKAGTLYKRVGGYLFLSSDGATLPEQVSHDAAALQLAHMPGPPPLA